MRTVPPVFQLYRFRDDTAVWWRLVSPNGRGIARTTTPLASAASAHAHLDGVRSALADLEPVLRLTDTYRWQWLLTRDGAPVVQGIGDQDRRVRCAHACRNFVDLAALAHVDPVIATFRRVTAGPPRSARAAT